MQVNLQTLCGVLLNGDALVAMLLSPDTNVQRIRLNAIMANPEKLNELVHTVNCLRNNLRVLALDTVEVDKS